ncbi:hypothetical protein PIB30_022110 [Stylosanthes scabra]|uniref:Pentatricopeptide repeat-containing protein n=1 Tax=Stylosanthes scabra TaxID=79078 RepID=A0ABU6S9T5_9FABA|nr:hypothetical protein [Stylosanthes scabra]
MHRLMKGLHLTKQVEASLKMRSILKKLGTTTRYANLINSNHIPSLPRYAFHSRCNRVDDAIASFDSLLNKRPLPSIVEFNKILGFLVKTDQYRIVVSLVPQLECRGITPSVITLSILINCFCHLSLMDSAFSVLAKITKLGHELNVITLTTLLKGFCINGMVMEALEFHNKARSLGFQFDKISYGTLINGLCKAGRTNAAIELLQKLDRDPVKPDAVN